MEQVLITPAELKKKLDADQIRFVFDLRNPEDVAGWKIEGRSDIDMLNIPQPDFIGEEERHVHKLPKDRTILTVCAHGDASKYTADLLREQGFDAVSLLGGMEGWSEYYEMHRVEAGIFQIMRPARGCMTHVIISRNEAVVIDAVRHLDRIMELVGPLDATITHVLDTHLQADHISGGPELAKRTGAAYHIHPLDAEGASYGYMPLADGEVIRFGASGLKTLHSPGHTPGSTSFLLDERMLFAGDTIMKTSIGRPDLGGKAASWSRFLYDTLFTRFAGLPDDLLILPSHAASIREQGQMGVVATTLGHARTSGLYRLRDFEAFLSSIQGSLPESPERYQEIRRVNLGLLDPDEKKRKELEIGKNLCGMAKQEQDAEGL